jgi:CRISPR-associated endonuclease Cas2
MAWIVAYDIACPRRWRRLYRFVRERGVRLQWSVFLITEANFEPRVFLAEAARLIDLCADDVRLYKVTGSIVGSLDRQALGEPAEGVQWRAPPRRTVSRFRSPEA